MFIADLGAILNMIWRGQKEDCFPDKKVLLWAYTATNSVGASIRDEVWLGLWLNHILLWS